MVSLAETQPAKSPSVQSLGYDFALLGLQARESRVEVIRNAAEKTALKIQSGADEEQRVEMLSELAASTYRLLDPRRRRRTMERVQLCNVSESEPALATVAKSPLLAPEIFATGNPDSLVVAELVSEDQSDERSESPSQGTVQLVSRLHEGKSIKRRMGCRLGLTAVATLTGLLGSIAIVSWLMTV